MKRLILKPHARFFCSREKFWARVSLPLVDLNGKFPLGAEGLRKLKELEEDLAREIIKLKGVLAKIR